MDRPDPTRLSDLIAYEREREPVVKNAQRFAAGLPANNVLLYGERGTGKSSTVKALFIRWKTLAQLKNLTLSDFLEAGSKHLERCVVLLILGDDYSFVYQGAEYREAIGADIGGKFISEIDTRVARDMRKVYDQVRETGMPVRLIFASESATFAIGWERLIIPIVIGGEVRMLLTYSEPLNTANDVHRYLFDSSPHMLIVALPISNYENEIVDADSFQPVDLTAGPAVAALAVKFGSTRLIDNIELIPGNS